MTHNIPPMPEAVFDDNGMRSLGAVAIREEALEVWGQTLARRVQALEAANESLLEVLKTTPCTHQGNVECLTTSWDKGWYCPRCAAIAKAEGRSSE